MQHCVDRAFCRERRNAHSKHGKTRRQYIIRERCHSVCSPWRSITDDCAISLRCQCSSATLVRALAPPQIALLQDSCVVETCPKTYSYLGQVTDVIDARTVRQVQFRGEQCRRFRCSRSSPCPVNRDNAFSLRACRLQSASAETRKLSCRRD